MFLSPIAVQHGTQTPRRRSNNSLQLAEFGLSRLINHANRPSRTSSTYTPSAAQLEQSRLNALESLQMASHTQCITVRHSAPNSLSRASRLLSNLPFFTSDTTVSIPHSPTESRPRNRVRDSQNVRVQTPRPIPLQDAPPRFLIPTSDPDARQHLDLVAAERAREQRLLRTKHEFGTRDLDRMVFDAMHFEETMHGASPGAQYVSVRRGFLTEISEFHGFCYSAPINVRICIYPVKDEESEKKEKTLVRAKVGKAFGSETMKNRWSKICVGNHSIMYTPPSVPFERMLKIRLQIFMRYADSGDILLEGSLADENSVYIQHKSHSMTSHASVIYKDSISGIPYLLTSQKWPKRIRNDQKLQDQLLDLETFRLVDGVQIHPLASYVTDQIKRGSYFIFRRLRRKNDRVGQCERMAIAQGLHEWYMEHQGVKHPNMSEQRRRLKDAKQMKAWTSTEPVETGTPVTFTSAQVVMESLKHAGILSSRISAHRARLSSAGYFEMRDIEHPQAGAFEYDVLAYVHGTSSSGHHTSVTDWCDYSNVRITETGDV